MSDFEKRSRERMRITADYSVSDDGETTLRVIGFASKPGAGLTCLATSVPVQGIPGHEQRRRLEDMYVKRLIKRIRAFERGELPQPKEGAVTVEYSQTPEEERGPSALA